MLDIPTARTNRQVRRQPAVQIGSGLAGGEPTAPAAPAAPAMPVEGATSMAAAQPTALSQTQPYEYAGQGWNDPIAQQVMKDYYAEPKWTTGSGENLFDVSLRNAQAYNDTPGVYHSKLDPASWGTVFKGDEMNQVTEDYKTAGGTYFNQFTPAQQAGVPYYAATGEPAPVMNMQTGVAETPVLNSAGLVTGQTPTPVGGTGSYHTLGPEVINKMWR